VTTEKAEEKIGGLTDDSWLTGGDHGPMGIEQTRRLCTLEAAVGEAQACPEHCCPFWEPGGAVLSGRCAFEQIGFDPDPRFAAWLLEIRGRLESAGSAAEKDSARRLFHHMLNDSSE
jgi:hypothetical protein